MAASSAPSTPHVSGTPKTWENVTGASKIPSTGGASNCKCAMPPGSSSLSMAQWVGQRPQKMSQTRRANLVSPVSNQKEKQLSSDSCSHSDISVRLVPDGTNGSLISKYGTSGPQQHKAKLEHVQSPHRLSESEESVGGESRLKEKGKGNNETDANDGKSDDDSEEPLAAANHARNASYLACSSAFWKKKMGPIFASVSSKDKFYLSMQLKSAQDIQESIPQLHGREINFSLSSQSLLHATSNERDEKPQCSHSRFCDV